jgi:serine/arginine repetitive matrix protein 1
MATSVDAKLLKSTKFPVEFNQKVDMQKVNVEVMKKWAVRMLPAALTGTDVILWYRWIAGKISEILGNEDDVVIELCFNLIEGARFVCSLERT